MPCHTRRARGLLAINAITDISIRAFGHDCRCCLQLLAIRLAAIIIEEIYFTRQLMPSRLHEHAVIDTATLGMSCHAAGEGAPLAMLAAKRRRAARPPVHYATLRHYGARLLRRYMLSVPPQHLRYLPTLFTTTLPRHATTSRPLLATCHGLPPLRFRYADAARRAPRHCYVDSRCLRAITRWPCRYVTPLMPILPPLRVTLSPCSVATATRLLLPLHIGDMIH